MLPLAGTLNGTEPSWLISSPAQFLLHRLSLSCSCMEQQAQVNVYQKKHLSTLYQAVLVLHQGCLQDLLSSTNCQCVSPQSVFFLEHHEEAKSSHCLYRHNYEVTTHEGRSAGDPLEHQSYLKREQVLSSAILNTPSSLTLFLCTVPPNTLFIICNTKTKNN